MRDEWPEDDGPPSRLILAKAVTTRGMLGDGRSSGRRPEGGVKRSMKPGSYHAGAVASPVEHLPVRLAPLTGSIQFDRAALDEQAGSGLRQSIG
jgi:hypothetical protein